MTKLPDPLVKKLAEALHNAPGVECSHVDYKTPTCEVDAEALRATVIEIVQEALTDCLHPEFGSEWQEPDGLLFKAYVSGKREGWEECAEYCENDPALRFHLRKKNPYA